MTLPDSLSDAELLQLMLSGNEEAFTTLFRRRQGSIYQFAMHMSGSHAMADDITQEVFLILIRDSKTYDPTRGSLAAYLCGIARNLILRRLDHDRLYAPMIEERNELETTTSSMADRGDPLGDLTRNETIESVKQAVGSLPGLYREVVVLCDLQEMSYVEAANVIGCAIGTVRSRLHRARALLIEKLRTNEKANTDLTNRGTKRCFA